MLLFRQHHGIPAHRIRCLIVSTTWYELLVPFSEFRRVCETQTEGFKIEVDDTGKVLKAENITDYVEKMPPQPFKMHCVYLYQTADERKKALPILQDAYHQAKAEGYLLVHLEYQGGSSHIVYPFALYFVPTLINGEVMAKLTKDAVAELKEGGEEPDMESVRHSAEDSFLASVNHLISDHARKTNLEISVGNPESFTAMVEGGWKAHTIERVGTHKSDLIFADADIVNIIKGITGDSTVRYSRLGSPKDKLDWEQIRFESANSLRGNPVWQAGFAWFLDYVEANFPNGTAFLQVYNPLMLPESLYRYLVEGDPEYMPQLALMVISADGTRQEGLVGTVVWDGKMIPASVEKVFTEDFCHGIHEYYMHKTTGTAWQLDEELMKRHGLQYSLDWLAFGKNKIEQRKRLVLNADGNVVESTEAEPQKLGPDLDAAETYLSELFGEIDANVARPFTQ